MKSPLRRRVVQIQANPRFPPAYAWLAASCIKLRHLSEARDAAAKVLETEPGFRCSTWLGLKNSPLAHRDAVIPSLREAGLPE